MRRLAWLCGGVLSLGCARTEPAPQEEATRSGTTGAPDDQAAQAPEERAADGVAACIETALGDTANAPEVLHALCVEVIRTRTPGAVLSIASKQGPPLTIAVGVRCKGSDSPVVPETSFRIGSITKSLLAAAVVRHAAQEHWSLDEPVTGHLPGLSPAYAGVSWRDLLNHTAGLSETPPLPHHRGLSPPALARALSARPPRGETEQRYAYVNAGYVLLGMALSNRAKTPVVDLVRSVAFGGGPKPTGAVEAGEHELDETACGHLLGRPVTVHDDLALLAQGATWSFAAGGVVMPAPALAQAGLELATDLQTEKTVATEHPPWRYALGLRRRTLVDGTQHWLHAGMTGNFAGELHILPDHGVAVAVLANSGAYLRAAGFAALAHAVPGVDLGTTD